MQKAPFAEYFPLAHLGHAIWVGEYSPRNVFVMLTAYFDDAGGADHGFTVVSGWISTVARWERFHVDWKLLLAHYKLPYFSMKECAQFKGIFKAWKDCLGTRDNFLRDAADIIRAQVLYGIGRVVPHGAFDGVNQRYTLKPYIGSYYALAGRLCVKGAMEWGLQNGYEGQALAYVFDRGTPKSGTLKTLLEREGLADPIFRSPRDIYHDGTLLQAGMMPLQAADFLAYEMRKIRRDDPGELWPIPRYRKTVRALASVPSHYGESREADLESLCRDHPKIKKRQ